MARSLIDGIYDLYLHRSGKGHLWEVPVGYDNNGKQDEFIVEVWAQTETEAYERALMHARTYAANSQKGNALRSLGIVLPREQYRPKKVLGWWLVWKDPVYQKSYRSLTSFSGYKAFTLTRIAMASLREQYAGGTSGEELTPQTLKRYLRNNIITGGVYTALFILGAVFALVGMHPSIIERMFLGWFNHYLIGGLVCMGLATISLIRTVRDYRYLNLALQQIEQNGEESPLDDPHAMNGQVPDPITGTRDSFVTSNEDPLPIEVSHSGEGRTEK